MLGNRSRRPGSRSTHGVLTWSLLRCEREPIYGSGTTLARGGDEGLDRLRGCGTKTYRMNTQPRILGNTLVAPPGLCDRDRCICAVRFDRHESAGRIQLRLPFRRRGAAMDRNPFAPRRQGCQTTCPALTTRLECVRRGMCAVPPAAGSTGHSAHRRGTREPAEAAAFVEIVEDRWRRGHYAAWTRDEFNEPRPLGPEKIPADLLARCRPKSPRENGCADGHYPAFWCGPADTGPRSALGGERDRAGIFPRHWNNVGIWWAARDSNPEPMG